MRITCFPLPRCCLHPVSLLGNGLQGCSAGARHREGYPTTILGLFGTLWATGFVLGCFFSPNVVKRIGHVRAFSVFTALIAIVPC